MSEITIQSGPLQASFRPELGGRLTRLTHEAYGEIVVPLTSANFDPLQWPKAGAFPLFPYHGRLAGARFEHEGRQIQLQPNSVLGADSMHGPAQRRPWQIAEVSQRQATLTLDYQADADWPFDFHARQGFRASAEGLAVDLQLANTGKVSMPGGIGWHPYFASSLDNLVCCDATRQWLRSETDLPLITPHRRETASGRLQNTPFTDHLANWSHASILSKAGQIRLIRLSGLSFLVAHRTSAYVCLEPTSQVAGVLALPEERRKEAGLSILEPGEIIQGRIALSFS